MMELMSGWDDAKLNEAKRAFEENNGWKVETEQY
jgi:hypothetical protein